MGGTVAMDGTAVSGTPLQDGSVEFVFPCLRIKTVGVWRVEVFVMHINFENEEARCCGKVLISTVFRVQEAELLGLELLKV